MSQPTGLPTKRYADAYRAASGVIALGITMKIVAAIVAAIMGIPPTVVAVQWVSNTSAELIQRLVMLAGIAIALVPGALIFIIGVIIAALGQILRATIDTAVNTSTLLTAEQRAELMNK